MEVLNASKQGATRPTSTPTFVFFHAHGGVGEVARLTVNNRRQLEIWGRGWRGRY